jgi:hypothetical protein
MAFVPKARFPNVPKLPGVPQLVRASTALQSAILPTVGLGIAGARLALAILAKPQWGVYRYDPPAPPGDGIVDAVTGETELAEVVVRPSNPVITPDNIFRVAYLQEFSLPEVPLQEGGFATYNKVASPYEMELRMTKGGTLAERAAFLDDCERAAASMTLYRILTPERTYQPVNIQGFSVMREGAQGAYFFAEVDIRFTEIRQVTAQYGTAGIDTPTTNAKDPSARPTQNQGTTNVISPVSRVQGMVDKVLAPLRTVSNLIG